MDMYVLSLILVAAAVTAIIRFAPFILLSKKNQEVPGWIQYLGSILPPAVMSVLLVYCLRGIDFATGSHGIPEIAATAVVVGLHLWKRNTLLSICVGTILYMVMIRIL